MCNSVHPDSSGKILPNNVIALAEKGILTIKEAGAAIYEESLKEIIKPSWFRKCLNIKPLTREEAVNILNREYVSLRYLKDLDRLLELQAAAKIVEPKEYMILSVSDLALLQSWA